jgi:hypothetical protein
LLPRLYASSVTTPVTPVFARFWASALMPLDDFAHFPIQNAPSRGAGTHAQR